MPDVGKADFGKKFRRGIVTARSVPKRSVRSVAYEAQRRNEASAEPWIARISGNVAPLKISKILADNISPMENKTERTLYKIRYVGEACDFFERDKIYLCVGEVVDGPQKGSLFVINEQGVDYLYDAKSFERV